MSQGRDQLWALAGAAVVVAAFTPVSISLFFLLAVVAAGLGFHLAPKSDQHACTELPCLLWLKEFAFHLQSASLPVRGLRRGIKADSSLLLFNFAIAKQTAYAVNKAAITTY